MNTLKTLEYDIILEFVARYAQIEATKKHIIDIVPMENYEKILLCLNQTDEARQHIVSFQRMNFEKIDVNPDMLDKAKKGAVLSATDCLKIYYLTNCYKKITNYIKNIRNTGSSLNYILPIINELIDLPELYDQIRQVIDLEGNILDNASKELFETRKKIKQEETRLRSKLQEILVSKASMLTEPLIVMRNERWCVPVRIEYKNTFRGIIQDESSSGSTVYIEPLTTIEICNTIQNLRNNEREIINTILRELSQQIGTNANDLTHNLEIFIQLDMIYAKAEYAIKFDCYKPNINTDGITELIRGRHPLLNQETVVPLDITIGRDYRTIIITGPNTGGKTVALKTIGLLTLMVQAGLLIPAEEHSNMAIYKQVLADIGDDQSITQSLSTFSSHMKKIITFINQISANSLVLFDELGSGTDPKEGVCLATAILFYLRKHQANIIVTTHYSELKSLAYREDDIINACVEFDFKSLAPTYKLLLGIPGRSNAIEISRSLGLKEEIIEAAKAMNIAEDDSVNKMIKKLENESLVLENRVNEYQLLSTETKALKKEYEFQQNKLLNEKQRIIDEARAEAAKIFSEAQKKANELIDEISSLKENFEEHRLAEVKHKVKGLVVEEPSIDLTNKEINVGDNVFVIPYNQEGNVTKIDRNRYTVALGNINATFKKTDLNYTGTTKKKPKRKSEMVSTISKDAKLELDLRGYRYEEAMVALDQFIDRALYANSSVVYIIHGFGTGAIRKVVTEYLKKCPYIKSTRFGGEGEGLNGVTVAYLK